jgi:hypothetical protein
VGPRYWETAYGERHELVEWASTVGSGNGYAGTRHMRETFFNSSTPTLQP